MKKLFTSLTALALVSAMVVPVAAFADDSTTVTSAYTSSYTVNIPAEIALTAANGRAADLTVSVKATELYGTLTVTPVIPEGGFKLNNTATGATDSIACTVGGAVSWTTADSGTIVDSTDYANNTILGVGKTINFSVANQTPAFPSTYSNTITFTITNPTGATT